MGTWDSSILGNDASNEIRETFLDYYDDGFSTKAILTLIFRRKNEIFNYERTNAWLGLAYVTWECGVLNRKIFSEIKKIIESKEDLDNWESSPLKIEREQKLKDFFSKISTKNENIRKRKKKKKPEKIDSFLKEGMCISYQNDEKKYIGLYIIQIHFLKNEGKIMFYFMDFESEESPTLEMFKKSQLFGMNKLTKKWVGYNYKYHGHMSNLNYNKKDKEKFFQLLPSLFNYIGQLTPINHDKVTNNFFGGFMDFTSSKTALQKIEQIRIERMNSLKLSQFDLGTLLKKIGKEK